MLRSVISFALLLAIFCVGLRVPVIGQANALPTTTPAANTVSVVPDRDLKRSIEAESAKLKKESEFNVERAEKERIRQATSKGGLSKKDKTLLALFAVGITVLVILLIKYGKDCVRYTPAGCSFGSDDLCYCEEYAE